MSNVVMMDAIIVLHALGFPIFEQKIRRMISMHSPKLQEHCPRQRQLHKTWLYKKPRCIINGYHNQSEAHSLCNKHGSQQHCTSDNCTKPVMREKMCYYHWRLTKSRGTVSDIDLVRNVVMDYLGMNNWKHVH